MARPETWEQQENETPKAFAAFCAYRDMGAGRSFDKAYRQSENIPQNVPKIAPRNWTVWAAEHEWVSRARAFDADEDRKRRALRDEAQKQAARKFQDDLSKDAENTATILRALQSKVAERVKTLDVANFPDRNLPALITALGGSLKTAHDVRASVLGLDELLKTLDEEQEANGG